MVDVNVALEKKISSGYENELQSLRNRVNELEAIVEKNSEEIDVTFEMCHKV